jgi:hypothetical protein
MGGPEAEDVPTRMQRKVSSMVRNLRLPATKAAKAFWILWLLSILCFASVLVIGATDEDIIGAVPIGVMLASPFIVLGILCSYWTDARSYHWARATWLFASLALLGSTVVLLNRGLSNFDLILAYAGSSLSFPLGLLGIFLGTRLVPAAGIGQALVMWGVSVAIGYVQWFVLVPAILKKRRVS